MDSIQAPKARKGRGAISAPDSRFDIESREKIHIGWPSDEEEPAPLRTTVSIDATKTIIARNKSPDIGFEQSINAYRGCEHGCIYCFARPSHAYLGLSPGLDFETKLWAKPDAAKLLAAELSRRTYQCKVIAIGTNTDPYQPIEQQYRITRQVLEVLATFNHPVSIVTKSALVLRDIDILAPMAAKGLASVSLSVTTLDRHLARLMEPRASTPARRLAAISGLNAAGIPTGVLAAPMIPALNDAELEAILEAARDHGAIRAGYVLLRLPHELKQLFEEWLVEHVPDKASHVLSLVRQVRDGKLYDAEFGSRFVGSGPYADLLRQRFHLAVKRLGLNDDGRTMRLDTTQFKAPAKRGDQLSMF